MLKDLVQNFGKYETPTNKRISRYVRDRITMYEGSPTRKRLEKKVKKLQACWDQNPLKENKGQGKFFADINLNLVKEQQLIQRAIATNNFRIEPNFTLSATGNTPMENAINMQDLLDSNNKQIKYNMLTKVPVIDRCAKYGSCVVITEHGYKSKGGMQTVIDPLIGAQRVPYNQSTINACTYIIDSLNYGQNPYSTSCDDSDFRYHLQRYTPAQLFGIIQRDPSMFIKENVEKVFKEIKKNNQVEEKYYDQQGRQVGSDFNKTLLSDCVIGQFQILIEDNEDDDTYYDVWMIGDTIIRFGDNPYDKNMNKYTVMTFEPSLRDWFGDTPAEYLISNENALNLLNSIGFENLIASMKRYVFYNKGMFADGFNLNQYPMNSFIPANIPAGTNASQMLFTYQVPDTSGNANSDIYQRIMQQNLSTSPDLSTPISQGGMNNKTAAAANIVTNKGDTKDADVLEQLSFRFASVAEKQIIILQQFLGNSNDIEVKPAGNKPTRVIGKKDIMGNMFVETNVQKSYQGEMQRYMNFITWFKNLQGSSPELGQANIVPMVRQVLRLSQTLKADDVLPETLEQAPGYQPTQVQPGQEQAGPAQEAQPQPNQLMEEMNA